MVLALLSETNKTQMKYSFIIIVQKVIKYAGCIFINYGEVHVLRLFCLLSLRSLLILLAVALLAVTHACCI